MLTIPEYIEIRTAAGAPAAYLSPGADGLKDCWIDAELNGQCTLSFALPMTSEKWTNLTDANRIVAGGREFVIIKPDAVEISREGQKVWGKVIAQESWVLLNKKYITVSNDPADPTPDWGTVKILADGIPFPGCTAGSAQSALSYLLQGTEWSVGVVDVTGAYDLETEKDHLLANINKVQELWGGYFVWDNLNKVVHLRSESDWQNYTGFHIRYAKNLKSITRNVDYDIVTRIYPFGADDLNISGVNGGVIYLDNFQHTSDIREGIYKNQDIKDAQKLKEKATEILNSLSRPRYNYKVNLVDLRTLPEYAHEDFTLGDLVDVIDENIGIDVRVRLIRHKYNVFQPWECDLEIGDPLEYLANMIADSKKAAEFVKDALKPNEGIGNILKGFINTFATQINSSNGKLIWNDSTFEAVEIDGSGNPTGKRVRITPGGIGISTDGGQTFVTAMTGAGIMANTVIVNSLYALSTDDGFTKLMASGLHVFDQNEMERLIAGWWMDGATKRFGLRVTAADGTTTLLDDQGLLQTWQEGRADNVDDSHPLILNIYVPDETISIYKGLLRFKRLAFRAYETGASSGGSYSSTRTSNSGGSVSTVALSGGGGYETTTTEKDFGYFSQLFYTDTDQGHQHEYWDDPVGSNVTDYDGVHSHLVNAHGHDIYISPHTHDIEIPSHTHNVSINIPSHSHEILYGIYQSSIPSTVTVKINGTIAGSYSSDQNSINLQPYLIINQWNAIELWANGLGRIDATAFIQAKMGV
ncbi:MAG: hypothetical protein JL50_10170 [Peptococcaceae bacterium BICA1-7]|nr:MAG: hypothetical protein JL50_10170 [Peptococcaceae bacterium BICA1-7]HBV95649.1 hypothetical protein [Desulfotomaculum sp.]